MVGPLGIPQWHSSFLCSACDLCLFKTVFDRSWINRSLLRNGSWVTRIPGVTGSWQWEVPISVHTVGGTLDVRLAVWVTSVPCKPNGSELNLTIRLNCAPVTLARTLYFSVWLARWVSSGIILCVLVEREDWKKLRTSPQRSRQTDAEYVSFSSFITAFYRELLNRPNLHVMLFGRSLVMPLSKKEYWSFWKTTEKSELWNSPRNVSVEPDGRRRRGKNLWKLWRPCVLSSCTIYCSYGWPNRTCLVLENTGRVLVLKFTLMTGWFCVVM